MDEYWKYSYSHCRADKEGKDECYKNKVRNKLYDSSKKHTNDIMLRGPKIHVDGVENS